MARNTVNTIRAKSNVKKVNRFFIALLKDEMKFDDFKEKLNELKKIKGFSQSAIVEYEGLSEKMDAEILKLSEDI